MRIKTLSALIALGLSGAALQAHALDDRLYIAPSASYVVPDDDRNADNGWGLGAALGKPLNENWNIEFGYRFNTMDRDAGGEFDQHALGLDGLYFFNRNPAFAPYAVMGLGYLRTEITGDADNSVMANLGLGFTRQLSDNVALRADARYRMNTNDLSAYNDDSFGDWLVNVGLNIALGQKAQPAPKAEPAPEPAAAPADSDGDGVTDDKDRCPGTPAGAKVNAEGCELDSDGDGVIDRLDRCPDTPKGRKVNAQGCELDSDGDGVVDAMDQCPNTPAGDKVDNKGCTLAPVIVLHGVNFAHDSAKLLSGAKSTLDDAVTTLKRYPDLKVEVAGHTDSQGADAYNQKLSQRRAKAVVDYFVAQGIAAERLSAKGYGESQPIASNATAEGRGKNRRVELRIIEK